MIDAKQRFDIDAGVPARTRTVIRAFAPAQTEEEFIKLLGVSGCAAATEIQATPLPTSTFQGLNPWLRKPPVRIGETGDERRARVYAAMGAFPHSSGHDTLEFIEEKRQRLDEEQFGSW